jgi:hypothetical protein
MQAPLIPRTGSQQADIGISEIGASVDAVRKCKLLNGRETNTMVIVASGESQNVKHSLRRIPEGFFVCFFMGEYPMFSVTKIDASEIRITSKASVAGESRFKLWVY